VERILYQRLMFFSLLFLFDFFFGGCTWGLLLEGLYPVRKRFLFIHAAVLFIFYAFLLFGRERGIGDGLRNKLDVMIWLDVWMGCYVCTIPKLYKIDIYIVFLYRYYISSTRMRYPFRLALGNSGISYSCFHFGFMNTDTYLGISSLYNEQFISSPTPLPCFVFPLVKAYIHPTQPILPAQHDTCPRTLL
jgi:hypothetical protein